jgi:simple sugar transport system permease protein
MVDLVTSILQASLPLSMPILYAAVGEVYAERAGVLNMGIEGVMTLSAFMSYWAMFLTGSYVIGILAGIGIAVALGLLHAFACIKIGVNQLIVGLLVYTIGNGIADFAYSHVTSVTIPPVLAPLPSLGHTVLADIPYVGPMLFEQNALVYLSIATAVVMGLLLYKTSWGLKIRAVGENPEAADAAGVNVNLTRTMCVLIGTALAGVGGASISIGYLGLYNTGDTIVAGRGWIAIVVVIFARWSPYRAIIGSWIFGLGYSLSSTLIVSGGGLPALLNNSYFLLMLPYIFALIVIIVFHRGTKPPSYLTVPYKRR